MCEFPLFIEAVTADTLTPFHHIFPECWTDWFEGDDPSAICLKPAGTFSVAAARNVIHNYNPTQGFVCRHTDQYQDDCRDYKVRFGCPYWETLDRLRKDHPGKICPKPSSLEAQTLSGLSVAAAGDLIYTYNPTQGFICRNKDQKSGNCRDYKVGFGCPCKY
uniref:Cartilage intermediate layer protein 2-like n=1 Tax=Stegastes partitus TaxID=144197 RepID=A0A3B4ZW14_9TELE